MLSRNLQRLLLSARPAVGQRMVHKGAEVTPPHNFVPFWTYPVTLTVGTVLLWGYPLWVITDVMKMRPHEELTLGDHIEGAPKTWAEHLERLK